MLLLLLLRLVMMVMVVVRHPKRQVRLQVLLPNSIVITLQSNTNTQHTRSVFQPAPIFVELSGIVVIVPFIGRTHFLSPNQQRQSTEV